MNGLSEFLAVFRLQMDTALAEEIPRSGQLVCGVLDWMAAEATIDDPEVDHLGQIGRRFLREARPVV